MKYATQDLPALDKFVGLPTKLLLRGDGGVTVRVWHAHLTDAGERGVDTLVAMRPLRVEVTYADDSGAPFANAHVTVLKGRGIDASACLV
ncbi:MULTISPECIES: hypothetical protein [Ralstonia]|jgi:hypothetical protein|uniref:Uncharacterized protein n=2 Tax=Ralstonia pickettii TaxID=329 RepID=R0E734_RALPI|nr:MULTISPECIES: hypothetical protein [Ralstonia]ENZ77969.1 hypothetical protein OR214_02245 [Ralstonia pickettii OR214]MCM3581936.1 hypothetical protein [Ralstonia pickettii]